MYELTQIRVNDCRIVEGVEPGRVDFDAITMARNIGTPTQEGYCPRCEIRAAAAIRRQEASIPRRVRWFFTYKAGLFSGFREWTCPQCDYMVRER